MVERPGIPANADALTPAWMRQALAAGGAADLPAIEDMTVSRIGSEVGMQGDLLRCRLTWQGGDGPFQSVIVKLPSEVARTRRMSAMMQFYRREYDFYVQLGRRLPFRTPALHYGDCRGRKQDFVLVQEDLEGNDMVDPYHGASEEQAKGAVRTIAQLHGRYWGTYTNPSATGFYDCYNRKVKVLAQLAYLRYLPAALKHFGDNFTEDVRRLAEAFGPRIYDFMIDLGKRPMTFIHGDYWLYNLFYGKGGPNDVIVIDWQVSGIGSGLYDVSHFLVRSVTTDLRREIERDVVREYWEIIVDMGAEDLTFEECWDLYRQNMLSCLMILTVGVGLISHTQQLTRQLAETTMVRLAAAIEDLGSSEFLPTPRPFFSLPSAFSASSGLAYQLTKRLQ